MNGLRFTRKIFFEVHVAAIKTALHSRHKSILWQKLVPQTAKKTSNELHMNFKLNCDL